MIRKRDNFLQPDFNAKRIFLNGQAQRDALDRKDAPLDQRKSRILAFSSSERIDRINTLPEDCSINLEKLPMQDVIGFRTKCILFYNTFFTVDHKTQTLAVQFANSPFSSSIVVPVGYYTMETDPAKWNAPNSNPAIDLNDIDTTSSNSIWVGAMDSYPGDFRVALGMASAVASGDANNPYISRIVTDRITARLTLTWATGMGSVYADYVKTTMDRILSLPGGLTSPGKTVWPMRGSPNLEGPKRVAFESSALNNSELVGVAGFNLWNAVVPIIARRGEAQSWEPPVPSYVDFGGKSTITNFNITLRDPDSGEILETNCTDYCMWVEFFTLDSTPC